MTKGTIVGYFDKNEAKRTGRIVKQYSKGKNAGDYSILPTGYDRKQIVPWNRVVETY